MVTSRQSAAQMPPVLKVEGLSKSFGGVQAVDEVSIDILPGEVHGLVGENGAGKSTLLRTLAGEVAPDAGTLWVGGREMGALSPKESLEQGIALVHQELTYAPRLTVAESMALVAGFPRQGPLVDWRALHRWSAARLAEWEVDFGPRQRMGTLAPAQQVTVAIISAFARDPRIMVLDEPTASFSPPEVEHLHSVVRRLRDEGRSVVYVTHRLDEIFRITDRTTVMRDGRTIETRPTDSYDREGLVEAIIGRRESALAATPPPMSVGSAPVRLSVKDLTGERTERATFAVRAGEILGFAGLVGAGRTELFELLYGIARPTGGRIELDGEVISRGSPSKASDRGIGFVPEDRRRSGIVAQMSVRENMVLPTLARYSRRFSRLLRRRRQLEDVHRLAGQMNLRASAIEAKVGTLSGGNQQKAVIGRWLGQDRKVLIFDEPSRGVDIGAKQEIFDLIRESAESGAAVLIASSEVEELVGFCHRVLIMRERKIVGELTGNEIDPHEILRYCFGK